jgi:hypothetical protein
MNTTRFLVRISPPSTRVGETRLEQVEMTVLYFAYRPYL